MKTINQHIAVLMFSLISMGTAFAQLPVWPAGVDKGTPEDVFVVTQKGDAGEGSLRWAIEQANANSNYTSIIFDFEGYGEQVIQISTPLPQVLHQTIIEGNAITWCMPGPLDYVVIDYQNAVEDGLIIQADHCTVIGIQFKNFTKRGVHLGGSGNLLYQNSFVLESATADVVTAIDISPLIFRPADVFVNGVFANYIGCDFKEEAMAGNFARGVYIGRSLANLNPGQALHHQIGSIEHKNSFKQCQYSIYMREASNGSGSVKYGVEKNLISGNCYIEPSSGKAIFLERDPDLVNGPNNFEDYRKAPYEIEGDLNGISGKAESQDKVEVYTRTAVGEDQYSLCYILSADVNNAGDWEVSEEELNAVLGNIQLGDEFVATGTDINNNTTEFSSPFQLCIPPSSMFTYNACEGQTITFHPEVDASAEWQYFWNFGDVESGVANTSDAFSPTHRFTALGEVYTVTLTISNGSCERSTTLELITTPPLEAKFGWQPIGCTGAEVEVINTSYVPEAIGPVEFIWDFGDGETVNTHDLRVQHTYSEEGEYEISLVVRSLDQECQDQQSLLASVTPSFDVAISSKAASCPDSRDGRLTAELLYGARDYTYIWADDMGPLHTSSENKTSISGLAVGQYTLMVQDDLGCSRTFTTEVKSPILNFSPSILISDNTICADEVITLTATGGVGDIFWSNGASTASISTNEAGKYWVMFQDPLSGCKMRSEEVELFDVTPEITVIPGNTVGLCPDEKVLLSVQEVYGGDEYAWTKDGAPFSTSRSVVVSEYGNYKVVINDDGCQAEQDVLVFEETDCSNSNCDETYEVYEVVQDDCEEVYQLLAEYGSKKAHDNYMKNFKEKFRRDYKKKCLEATLSLTRQYFDDTYMHTLFYYDQSGNLVKTVPPKGVNKLTTAPVDPMGDRVVPNHTYETVYKYNAQRELIAAVTPDVDLLQSEGKLEAPVLEDQDHFGQLFFYDPLGRMIVSQHAKYKNNANGFEEYGYVLYNKKGNAIESGKIKTTTPVSALLDQTMAGLTGDFLQDYAYWLTLGERTEVVRMVYDHPFIEGFTHPYFKQENLRNRLSALVFYEDYNPSTPYAYHNAMHISYTVQGQMRQVLQDVPELQRVNSQFKLIEYTFNIQGRNIKEIAYQRNYTDEFYTRYHYGEGNRISEVWTSKNGEHWTRDVRYAFYKHGPLSRMELGDDVVQGMDFAYALNGWIKGVNSGTVDASRDMGKDGDVSLAENLNGLVGEDEYGMTMGYFQGDYSQINSSMSKFEATHASSSLAPTNGDQFNGNVSHMVVGLKEIGKFSGQETSRGTSFSYDQMGRLLKSVSHQDPALSGTNAWTPSATQAGYETTVAYDKLNNITSLTRKDDAGVVMDNLAYGYSSPATGGRLNNRLYTLTESASTDGSKGDIKNSSTYDYNEIGQLTQDLGEDIGEIVWTHRGMIKEVIRVDGSSMSDLEFAYGPTGKRIMKIVKPRTSSGIQKSRPFWEYTFYVHDAGGQLLSSYGMDYKVIEPDQFEERVWLKEHALNAPRRIGTQTYERHENVVGRAKVRDVAGELLLFELIPPSSPLGADSLTKGTKHYELIDHRNSVYAVVSDRLYRGMTTEGDVQTKADVLAVHDYYPYGMQLPGRQFDLVENRFGFGGGKLDVEFKNGSNNLDLGSRMYDPRVGRLLSLDPYASSYAAHSPYHYALNNPIAYVDRDGEWVQIAIGAAAGVVFDVGYQLMFEDEYDWRKTVVAGVAGGLSGGLSLMAGVAGGTTGAVMSNRLYKGASSAAMDMAEMAATDAWVNGKVDATDLAVTGAFGFVTGTFGLDSKIREKVQAHFAKKAYRENVIKGGTSLYEHYLGDMAQDIKDNIAQYNKWQILGDFDFKISPKKLYMELFFDKMADKAAGKMTKVPLRTATKDAVNAEEAAWDRLAEHRLKVQPPKVPGAPAGAFPPMPAMGTGATEIEDKNGNVIGTYTLGAGDDWSHYEMVYEADGWHVVFYQDENGNWAPKRNDGGEATGEANMN